MSQTYFAILTAIGEAKLANATALGTTLQLTQMGVGDGNGSTPLPNRSQTALVRENRRAPLNRLFVDPANASQIIAEQVIPEEIGGWWIREIGLYDTDGNLCAVANCPDTYKPVLAEGSGRTQVIRMVLIVSNTAAVQLKIDPAIVLATRGYVDDEFGKHLAVLDPHPQYMTAPEVASAISGKADKAITLAGYGISDGATLSLVTQAAPPGMVAFFGVSPAPDGWLKANGAEISRTVYAALFAAIGTTFGAGNGSTTFRLPDLRGEFLRGFDDGRGADQGRLRGTWQESQNLSHTHSVNDQSHDINQWLAFTRPDINPNAINDTTGYLSGAGSMANDRLFYINNSGGNESRPRNVALLACIKY